MIRIVSQFIDCLDILERTLPYRFKVMDIEAETHFRYRPSIDIIAEIQLNRTPYWIEATVSDFSESYVPWKITINRAGTIAIPINERRERTFEMSVHQDNIDNDAAKLLKIIDEITTLDDLRKY